MTKFYFSVLAAIVSTTMTQIYAQPGSLDLSFSGDGKVTTGFNLPQNASGRSIALQPDGKMVVCGFVSAGSNQDFALLRYTTTGSLDPAFSSDGKVTLDIAGANQEFSDVAIQADGKIVAVGFSTEAGKKKFAVVRFNPGGSLDNTFSSDGIATTGMGNGDASAYAITIQGDGKIVVAGGYSEAGIPDQFAVARYNTNGSLDNSFNFKIGSTGGIIKTNTDARAFCIALQQDGKIVVAGSNPPNTYITIVRYDKNGFIDNSFDGDGIVKANGAFGGGDIKINGGKILIVGIALKDGGVFGGFVTFRFNDNGSPDNTFGSGGRVVTDIGSEYSQATSVVVQGDGKIIAGGYSNGNKARFAMVRYNSSGSLDNTFGAGGIVTTNMGGKTARPSAIILRSNGRIVITGYLELRIDLNIVATACYTANGLLDNSFGSDGIVYTDFRGSAVAADIGQAVAIQQDGKIVVAGNSNNTVHNDLAIVRFNSGGTLDAGGAISSGFNGNGKLVRIFPGDFSANAVAIQQDGKILIAGGLHNGSNYDFALVRYNSNGTPDNSFNLDGLVTTAIGNSHDVGYAVAVQTDGKILVAGYSNNGSNVDFAVVRYNTDGSPDNFFSLDGKATTDFGSRDNYGTSLAIQQDGKIVVAGYSYNGSNNDFAVVRYKTNGDLDPTFNNLTGKATIDISNNDQGQSVAIQSDGKIVIAGNSHNGSDRDFSVARFNSNGTRDNSFSGDAKLLTTIDGTSNDYGKSVKVQSDGKIIVGGYSYKSSINKYDFALVRYSSTGTADGTFGTNGKVLTDFNATNDYGNAMALQQDGKLVVAGTSNNDFAVARYNLGAAVVGQSGTLEAELAVLNGAVVSSSQPGYTGSGFADYVNASNDYIEWTLNASSAGSFSLNFRYSNGGGSNRPLKLQVNGVQVAASLAFVPTGGWATWALSSSTANLVSGSNKIKLSTTGSNGPNVDHLAYSSNASIQSAERFASGKMMATYDFLKAYVTPNPAQGNAKLIISTTSDLPINFQLIDLSGKTYKKVKMSLRGSNTFDLPVNALVPGSYTIILRQGKLSTSARMIVRGK